MNKGIAVSAVLLLVCMQCISQTLSEREITRISRLGIESNLYDLNRAEIQTDFSTILEVDRKRKINKTFGIILSAFSVLTSSYGIYALSSDSGNGTGNAIADIIGGTSLGLGVISGGFSVKLFKSSKKRKKERDKFMKIYEKLE